MAPLALSRAEGCGASRRSQPYRHLEFSPVRFVANSYPTDLPAGTVPLSHQLLVTHYTHPPGDASLSTHRVLSLDL